MAFEESRFPVTISYGSAGGPGFSTRIITTASGYEDRNANWEESKRKYDVAYGVKNMIDLENLVNWFESMKGPYTGFRYKDHLDWKSCATEVTPAKDDQVLLASAVGGETTTQIIKTYTTGGVSTVRDVKKPITGTVLVERNGGLLIESTDYDIDYTTGLITWDTGIFPSGLTASDVIKAGYEFDVAVRFVNDAISIVIDDYLLGSSSVPIVEIRV